MSFNPRYCSTNVGALGVAGPKIHTYSSDESLATVAGSGYFNAIKDVITTGDFMLVYSSAVSGGGRKIYGLTNTAGVITCPVGAAFS